MAKIKQKGKGNQASTGDSSPNLKGNDNQISFGDNSPNARDSKIHQQLTSKQKLNWFTGGIILPVVAGLIIEIIKEGFVSEIFGYLIGVFK